MGSRQDLTRRACVVALGLLLAGLAAVTPGFAAERRPNIVFILSDDEDLASHRVMPRVRALIEEQGTVFANALVTYSLCSPSRASILRGQYPHNTQALGNLPPDGGFKTFRRLKREQSTVATWLQEAGYRTAFYGKYLNGYTARDTPPPGWDEWHAANNDGYFNFNYKLNENGKVVAYGDAPQNYLTDVISRKAVAHIRRWSRERRPFFLYVAPFNPHSPYRAAPRHDALFRTAALPRPPSFNEAAMDDKPRYLQRRPRLSETDVADITEHYRARLRCLQAIDEMVADLVATLRQTGELDNTYIVYASDNGFHLGLHRMKEGKDTAYEEDIRVPMAVRGPNVPRGRTVSQMVLNIDLAPTFAAMAGIVPPAFVDGRSFLPLLIDSSTPWRRNFMVQRLGLEADQRLTVLSAIAIRTRRHLYTAYRNGESELYDLERDPFQLDNGAVTADPALVERLSTRLTELKACRGIECRQLENMLLESN